MEREEVCTMAEADVYEVIELMKRHRVNQVLVCDPGRYMLGMVTRSDLLRIFFDRYRQAEDPDWFR
jgi:CBS domain-containing protein